MKHTAIQLEETIPFRGEYDVIVAGGGVAGVAASLSASRLNKKVLLIEKGISLGGLATIGLVNLFVPMCNGRGRQIIKGMADEFLQLSIRYGYDSIPDEWKNGDPGPGAKRRLVSNFSPAIFSLVLTDLLVKEHVDILYDTVVTKPIMVGGHCTGLIVENKSGRGYYSAKIIVDTTGDADILYRAGVPTQQGRNFFTMMALATNLEHCEHAAQMQDIRYLYQSRAWGGTSTLYGKGHPEDMPVFQGTTGEDVTDFLIKNHQKMLESIQHDDRKTRDVIMLPAMAQFRETRTLIGDAVFSVESAYQHCPTSIGAICDFDRRDYLYEIPYGTLVKSGYDNLITAGRTASAQNDYSWDVLRVIPPAILTGQAAGVAAALAIDSGKSIAEIDVPSLQAILTAQNVIIHFDDAWIPQDTLPESKDEYGHV